MSGNKPTFYKSLRDLLSVSEGAACLFCGGQDPSGFGALTDDGNCISTDATLPPTNGRWNSSVT